MAAGGLLPVHQRFINGVQIPTNRRTLRLKEKYVIVLVFVTFAVFCFGTFFFLPDLREVVSVNDMRRQFRDAGQELFIPEANLDELAQAQGAQLQIPDSAKRKKGVIVKHDASSDFDLHVIKDRAKILQKIEEAREQEKMLSRLRRKLNISESLLKTGVLTDSGASILNLNSNLNSEKAVKLNKVPPVQSDSLNGAKKSDTISMNQAYDKDVKIDFINGAPKDAKVRERRDFVRNVGGILKFYISNDSYSLTR